PLPRQLPQLPLRPWRDEAALQQAALQQLGDPLAILDIGLASGHAAEMLGINQQHRETSLQEVEDRFPVDPGRFHGYLSHALGGQPIAQQLQLRSRRAEGADLTVDAAVSAEAAYACHHGLLVNIQAGAAGIQDLHSKTSLGVSTAPGTPKKPTVYPACLPYRAATIHECVAVSGSACNTGSSAPFFDRPSADACRLPSA